MKNNRVGWKMRFKEFNPEGDLSLAEWHDQFIELSDPTEYLPAIALCGTWKAWKRMKKNWHMFRKEILPEWQEELDASMRSVGVAGMCAQAIASPSAAKWLAEGGYKKLAGVDPNKKTKAELAEYEKRVQNKVETDTDDEVDRVLNVVRQFPSKA